MTSTEAMKYLIEHPRAKLQWYETDRKVYLFANEPFGGMLPEENLIQPYEHFLRWLKEGHVAIVDTSRGGLAGTIHSLRYRDVPQEKLVAMPEETSEILEGGTARWHYPPGYIGDDGAGYGPPPHAVRRDIWEKRDDAKMNEDFQKRQQHWDRVAEHRKTSQYPLSHDYIFPDEHGPEMTDLDNLG